MRVILSLLGTLAVSALWIPLGAAGLALGAWWLWSGVDSGDAVRVLGGAAALLYGHGVMSRLWATAMEGADDKERVADAHRRLLEIQKLQNRLDYAARHRSGEVPS